MALLNYRNFPRNEELGSPNQRIMCRNTNSLLPMKELLLKQKIVKNVATNLKNERQKQKHYFDQHVRPRDVPLINEKVNVQDPSTKLWQSGRVVAYSDKPRSVYVKIKDGLVVRRNTIHLKRSSANIQQKLDPVIDNSCNGSQQSGVEHNKQNGVRYITRSGRTVKPVQRMNL